jgi:glycosyltransferase involved in cell wall biosynthesis
MGVEVLYGYHFKKSWGEWLETNGDNLDIAYLNRPEISLKYIDQIKKYTKAKIVFFGHDLHFLREKRKYLQDNNPNTLEVSNFYLAKERSLFNLSDVIVTPNRYEAEIIKDMDSAYNVKVHTLYYFHKKTEKITDFSNRQSLLFVGGFHHLPNSDGILWFCKEVWHIVTNRIPSIRLVIVGSFVPKEVLELSCVNIEIKQNLSEAELNEEYEKARIVPIPLRYGAGVKGKTLEAMSKGLPIVSTSIGLEGIDDVLNFIIPKDDPISFAEEIISLYHDLERLELLSERAAACINKNYNVDVAIKSMKEILSF